MVVSLAAVWLRSMLEHAVRARVESATVRHGVVAGSDWYTSASGRYGDWTDSILTSVMGCDSRPRGTGEHPMKSTPWTRTHRGVLAVLAILSVAGTWLAPALAAAAAEPVTVDPDGTVRQATIVDQARLGSDPFYRAAAESARRAFFNPLCRPLHLPAEKYAIWKDLVVDFSPKDIL